MNGPARGLVKNMVMDGFVPWLKLSREYDPMRGIDRTVAYQRIMNLELSKNKKHARLQLLIWETNVDESETRYQSKLHTISKIMFSGVEQEQEKTALLRVYMRALFSVFIVHSAGARRL